MEPREPSWEPPLRLEIAAPDTSRLAPPAPATVVAPKTKLGGSSFLCGNGRAIFFGLLIGALLVSIAGFVHSHYPSVGPELAAVTRRFLAVRTQSVSAPKNVAGDGGLSVYVGPDLLRVTAIALGHPRLAIINGQQVTEGDSVVVRDRRGGVSVTLKVIDIKEGRVELANGSEIVTTRLAVPAGR